MPRVVYYIAIGWVVLQFLGILKVTFTDNTPTPAPEVKQDARTHYVGEPMTFGATSRVVVQGTWLVATSTVGSGYTKGIEKCSNITNDEARHQCQSDYEI